MFYGMEYVFEVYKEKSFSKAAANLYISQPALSAAIKKIEARIGMPLFDRSTNPVRLTDCGREFIKSAEEIMDVQNRFDSSVKDLRELRAGHIAIGANFLIASYVLPPIITQFKQRYPLVKAELIAASPSQLEKGLMDGNLDLIMDNYDFGESTYVRHMFFREQLILSVHKKFSSNDRARAYQLTYANIVTDEHLASSTPAAPISLFGGEPFILMTPGNDTRKRTDIICQNSAVSPYVILELDQLATAYSVACYGMGITLISDTLVKRMPPNPDIVYYKINDPEASRDAYIYHRKSKYVTFAMEEFLKLAAERDAAAV